MGMASVLLHCGFSLILIMDLVNLHGARAIATWGEGGRLYSYLKLQNVPDNKQQGLIGMPGLSDRKPSIEGILLYLQFIRYSVAIEHMSACSSLLRDIILQLLYCLILLHM